MTKSINTATRSATQPVRLGVIYDGAHYSRLLYYLAEPSSVHASLTYPGLHGALRWALYQDGRPLESISLVCADYVSGRPARRDAVRTDQFWDAVRAEYGIVRRDVTQHDGGRQNDLAFALGHVIRSRVQEQGLDAVALITSRGALVPTVERLRSEGVTVIVPDPPYINFTNEHGTHEIYVSPKLSGAAALAPDLLDLLTAALAPEYPLAFPFDQPVAGAVAQPAADGYWYGTVHRWRPKEWYGFVIDRGGQRWFVLRYKRRGVDLPLGQPVRFTKDTRPTNQRSHPQVADLEVYQPCGPIPS